MMMGMQMGMPGMAPGMPMGMPGMPMGMPMGMGPGMGAPAGTFLTLHMCVVTRVACGLTYASLVGCLAASVAGPPPTRVVVLANMVTEDDLKDETEYKVRRLWRYRPLFWID